MGRNFAAKLLLGMSFGIEILQGAKAFCKMSKFQVTWCGLRPLKFHAYIYRRVTYTILIYNNGIGEHRE